MAYEKHTWSCGETVTAELLNHMEDGIAEGGAKRFNISEDNVFAQTITNSVASLIGQMSGQYYCVINGTFPFVIGNNITQNEYDTLKSAAQYLATGDASFVIGDAVLSPIASGYNESKWYISVMLPVMSLGNYSVAITYTINNDSLVIRIERNNCNAEQ